MCSLAWIVAFLDSETLGHSHTLDQPFATRLDVPRPISTEEQLPTDIDQGVIQGTVGHLLLGEVVAEQETNIKVQSRAQAPRLHVRPEIYKEDRRLLPVSCNVLILILILILVHAFISAKPTALLPLEPASHLCVTLFAHITTTITTVTAAITTTPEPFFENQPRLSPNMCTLYRFHYSNCGCLSHEEVVRCASDAAMGYCPDGSPQVVDDYHDGYCPKHS